MVSSQARSLTILTGLTVAGGGYLMWHGAMTLARPPVPGAASVTGAAGTDRATFARGVGVSGLNPKGLLLLLALLPRFTDPHTHWPVAGQIGVLGFAFTAKVAVVCSGIGCLARTVLRTRPNVARLVSRFSGGGHDRHRCDAGGGPTALLTGRVTFRPHARVHGPIVARRSRPAQRVFDRPIGTLSRAGIRWRGTGSAFYDAARPVSRRCAGSWRSRRSR